MGRILVIIAAIAVLLILKNWFKQQYQKQGRPFAVKTLLLLVAGIFIVLTATGRAHWLGALLASMLAALRFALPLLIRSLPFLQKFLADKAHAQAFKQSQQQHHDSNSNLKQNNGEMSIEEALEVLGLETHPNKKSIIDAHRRLIQKLHPDRGGNDYLAAKINLAKDTLLKQAQ